MPRLLVTGAGGFVGRAVVARAAADGWAVRACTRQPRTDWPAGVEALHGLNLEPDTDWTDALAGVQAVVHCAARVHVMNESAADPLAEFRRVNTAGTLNLARQAAAAGVTRLVFISSIGVNGAETATGAPFRSDSPLAPHSPYAVSKLEAEAGLRQIAAESGIGVVVIRPPLVYGPGAPGNFAQLLKALNLGLPLPLGAVNNQRSFVAIDNLVDLVVICAQHPAAANQTFLVSDGEDLSTTALLRRTAKALGRPARLLPLPASALRFAARALGRAELAQRLFGSLQVDIEHTRTTLGWKPAVAVDEGLRRVAVRFLAEQQRHAAAVTPGS